MEITKSTLRNFRTDFQEAVKDLEKKYGIVIEIKGMTYRPNDFSMKILVQNGNSKEDVAKATFEKYCRQFGLSPYDYGREFTDNGVIYQIIGIDPNRRKNCIIVRAVKTGTQYVCKPEVIPSLATKSKTLLESHHCKYCGQLTPGDNEDELCPECQEDFGHTYYSEL